SGSAGSNAALAELRIDQPTPPSRGAVDPAAAHVGDRMLERPIRRLRLPVRQSTPDCQPLRSRWSASRKLKNAPTYGWQYASRTASASCVDWSTLLARAAAPRARDGRASSTEASFSRPV